MTNKLIYNGDAKIRITFKGNDRFEEYLCRDVVKVEIIKEVDEDEYDEDG